LFRQSVFGRLAGYEDVNTPTAWPSIRSLNPADRRTRTSGEFSFGAFGESSRGVDMPERCALRNGNVHSADGWRDVLDPVIARYARRDILRFFRADAAYAIPPIYARLEEAGYFYAIRRLRAPPSCA
jgi:hypothetical protein